MRWILAMLYPVLFIAGGMVQKESDKHLYKDGYINGEVSAGSRCAADRPTPFHLTPDSAWGSEEKMLFRHLTETINELHRLVFDLKRVRKP